MPITNCRKTWILKFKMKRKKKKHNNKTCIKMEKERRDPVKITGVCLKLPHFIY